VEERSRSSLLELTRRSGDPPSPRSPRCWALGLVGARRGARITDPCTTPMGIVVSSLGILASPEGCVATPARPGRSFKPSQERDYARRPLQLWRNHVTTPNGLVYTAGIRRPDAQSTLPDAQGTLRWWQRRDF
jgi:hypothetical protein